MGILTYRRPDGLRRVLASVAEHARSTVTDTWQVHDVTIIDNDVEPTAEAVVEGVRDAGFPFELHYIHEPRPGLSVARNRALDEASGDVLVFVDDDEEASPGWPEGLVTTMLATGAALVGGPVRTAFVAQPPAWVVDGGFFDRPEPPDRSPQHWLRSGNLAIDLGQVTEAGIRFDEAYSFTGGEDVAFSTAAREAGLTLSWSADASVVEHVPADRVNLGWIARRERTSTANWVRVELSHEPTLRRRAVVAARSAARLGQAVALAVFGAVTLDRPRMARAAVLGARAVGAVRGIAGRSTQAYRSESASSD